MRLTCSGHIISEPVRFVAQLQGMWLELGILSSLSSGMKQTMLLDHLRHHRKPEAFGRGIGSSTSCLHAWFLPLLSPGFFILMLLVESISSCKGSPLYHKKVISIASWNPLAISLQKNPRRFGDSTMMPSNSRKSSVEFIARADKITRCLVLGVKNPSQVI